MVARRIARTLMPAVIAVLLATPGCQGTETSEDAELSDQDHAAALKVANDFLRAWREQDVQAGLNLLSDRLRRAHTLTQIEDAVRGHPNVEHSAFTVSAGEPVGGDRFAFRVGLVFRFTGQAADRLESSSHRMVMVLNERGNWRVDSFPIPRD
ncbi:MAG: hypothetical protein ACLFVW_08145 [Phycisphaerae bacterium]